MKRTRKSTSRPHLKLVVNNCFPESCEPPKELPKLRKPRNIDVRPREYLRPDEVERLIEAAKTVGRHRQRDALIILMMWRHGLRVSEVIDLRWANIDWETAHIFIRRIKKGRDSNQPIDGNELRQLRTLKRESQNLPWIFVTERGTPLDDDTVRKMIKRAGSLGGFEFPIHPHMLRHACGYTLAAKGTDTRTIQDYLGHTNIQHTVKYTELAPGRFDGLWD